MLSKKFAYILMDANPEQKNLVANLYGRGDTVVLGA